MDDGKEGIGGKWTRRSFFEGTIGNLRCRFEKCSYFLGRGH